jgi:hypothetical protein
VSDVEVFGFRREDKDSLIGLIDGRRGTRVPPRNTAGDGHRILLVKAVAAITSGNVGEVQVVMSTNNGVTIATNAQIDGADYKFDALNLGPSMAANERRIAVREEFSGTWLLTFSPLAFDLRWVDTSATAGRLEKTKDNGLTWTQVLDAEVCD